MNGLRLIWRWFGSRAYRSAADEWRRTRTQLRCQRDLISPESAEAIQHALDQVRRSLLAADPPEVVRAARDHLHTTAYACLRDPRRHRFRDAAETLLAAVVAVLALRVFLVTPMVVPTASMQPTLYGVRVENLLADPEARIPGPARQWIEQVLYGRTYYEIRALGPGRLQAAETLQPVADWWGRLRRRTQQRFRIGDTWYTVTLPRFEMPEISGLPRDLYFLYHAGVDPERTYQPGDYIIKMAVTAGDHVLIDRLTINFRRPRRGEIIVFRATEIPRLRENAFYLKRLVAFGGETVQIGDDRHLRINGRRLDASTPRFEALYSFRGPPADGEYSGHIHDGHARLLGIKPGLLAPEFPNGRAVHRVAPGCVFVLGDNTVNSYDSRRFGDLPQTALVGRLLGVYWPVSERLGWGAQ